MNYFLVKRCHDSGKFRYVQIFVQVFSGETWTKHMCQPITDRHAYDEIASVALEVDPGHTTERTSEP